LQNTLLGYCNLSLSDEKDIWINFENKNDGNNYIKFLAKIHSKLNCKEYEEMYIEIIIIDAKGLTKEISPVISVIYDGKEFKKEIFKTKIKKSSNPVWNEKVKYKFQSSALSENIKLCLYHRIFKFLIIFLEELFGDFQLIDDITLKLDTVKKGKQNYSLEFENTNGILNFSIELRKIIKKKIEKKENVNNNNNSTLILKEKEEEINLNYIQNIPVFYNYNDFENENINNNNINEKKKVENNFHINDFENAFKTNTLKDYDDD
jgi:hypothetical protein